MLTTADMAIILYALESDSVDHLAPLPLVIISQRHAESGPRRSSTVRQSPGADGRGYI